MLDNPVQEDRLYCLPLYIVVHTLVFELYVLHVYMTYSSIRERVDKKERERKRVREGGSERGKEGGRGREENGV